MPACARLGLTMSDQAARRLTSVGGKTKPTRGAVRRVAGEPVLDGGNSPWLFRHSGLADTAHRAMYTSKDPVQ